MFAVFGRFLIGRADLLPSSHLRKLREIGFPRSEFPALGILERELGGRVSASARVYSAPYSEIYRALHGDQNIVVEVFRATAAEFKEDSWEDFRSGIRLLDDAAEYRVTAQPVLDEFREWLVLQADIERKRRMLRNMENAPAACISQFPALIPELQSSSVLAYQWVDGRALHLESAQKNLGGRNELQLLVEALLEQSLFLSLLPADFEISNLVLLEDERIGFQVVPAMIAIPPEWNLELLQYMASLVGGDNFRAVHALSRIVQGARPVSAEQRLWQAFSSLQPELKVNLATPATIGVLENFWRALAASGLKSPLILQLFHRQLAILGLYNGEIAPAADFVSESIWPVMGRILRFRLSEIASLEKAREWFMGGSLLFFETARQTALALDQLRDNDVSLSVDAGEKYPGERVKNRRVIALVVSATLLAVFLLALQIAFRAPSLKLEIIASAVVALTGTFLFSLIARLD